ncbi:transposase [Gemmatimonas sp.]|uniref:transposase n=1 Tax=Gemmatimonas sp. TaxID=1962908 RepID=UPI003DA29FD3
MPRSGRRKWYKYTVEFKHRAVRLSHQPGLQVKTVAAALEIHPFMFSKAGRQRAPGVVLALTQGGTNSRRRRPRRQYIRYYNRAGLHSSLNDMSPYRRRALRSILHECPRMWCKIQASYGGSLRSQLFDSLAG